ncbi:MAG TPA: aldo/keto reductase [Trebonia sp.]|nr:aldo/keto reductase [Trebonia sp.]
MTDLRLRQLGSTGADVSELALGTLTFGRETDEADSAKILGGYLDAGGNFIDTADAYGRSEEVLSPLIRGIRDDVLIGSKVGLPSPYGPRRRANSEGASRLRVLRQAEQTLRRLGTDWIDVYYVHAWDPVTPLDETLSALDSLVSSGKVRYLGVSNFFGWQIAKAMGRATLHGYETVSLVTAEYSLAERGAEREIMSLCRHERLAVMPWGPLAGGMLTGKYTDEASFEGTRAGSGTNSTATVRHRLSSQRNQATLQCVREISARIGKTPGQVALNWVLHAPGVTAPVIGVRTPEQLAGNLGAAGWQLDPADRLALDEASAIDPGYPAKWEARFGIRAGARPDREAEINPGPAAPGAGGASVTGSGRLPRLDAGPGQRVRGLSRRLAACPRYPPARLAHSRLDELEPGQHRCHVGGVVVPEPGMGGGLLEPSGELLVLVVPARHDQPRAPGRAAHVLGAHRGRRVGRQEMKHRGHDDGYRLGHVDHGAHLRIGEHGLRLGQVRPHGGEPLAAPEQRLPVNHGHRVDVHVAHPRVGDDIAHRLVHRRVGGQPRSEVEELGDARGGRAGGRGADELPVAPDQVRQCRVQLGHPRAHFPVGGEIVLPAEPVVVDAGDARPGHVDARRGVLGRHEHRLLSLVGRSHSPRP